MEASETYEKNSALTSLARDIKDDFDAWKGQNTLSGEAEYFTLYLRTFIGRYKELYTGDRNQKKGGETE